MTRTNPPPYPDEYYHADAVFDLQRGSEWGALTDGPADWDTLVEIIAGHFPDRPDMTRLRVWHFQPDVLPRDVTDDVMTPRFANLRDGGNMPRARRGLIRGIILTPFAMVAIWVAIYGVMSL